MAAKKPITYIFQEINKGKNKSIRYYKFSSHDGSTNNLGRQLGLHKNRKWSQYEYDYTLNIKESKNWNGCLIDMVKTSTKYIFKGHLNKKKHLLLFRFSTNADIITVYYYENYFTRNLAKLIKQL